MRTVGITALGATMLLIPLSRAQQTVDPRTAAAVEPPKGEEHAPGQPDVIQDKHTFGVLPNYRTAESSQPYSPITARQKFTISTKDTLDGPSYALAAMFSGISQLEGTNPSFGQGVKGYAHRYVTGLADQDLGNYMTEAILPSLLHQDPRYFRKGRGSFLGRVGWGKPGCGGPQRFRPLDFQHLGVSRQRNRGFDR